MYILNINLRILGVWKNICHVCICAMRCLASGCTFDAIKEMTCVAQETHRKFFHDIFCALGKQASRYHIKMPHDEDSLHHVTSLYEQKGLPGCVGSIDCVHVYWDQCPASLHSTCKGKDKQGTDTCI